MTAKKVTQLGVNKLVPWIYYNDETIVRDAPMAWPQSIYGVVSQYPWSVHGITGPHNQGYRLFHESFNSFSGGFPFNLILILLNFICYFRVELRLVDENII